MSLMEELAGEMAIETQRKTLALMGAGGRIRLAEFLQTKLTEGGLYVKSYGALVGGVVSLHLTAWAAAERVADVLCQHDVYFDVYKTPGQHALHFDCSVGSYNIIVLVLPPVDALLDEVA